MRQEEILNRDIKERFKRDLEFLIEELVEINGYRLLHKHLLEKNK